MNRIFFVFVFYICAMVVASCGDDDDNGISARKLAQTTWDCTRYTTNKETGCLGAYKNYIFEFTTDSTGKYITLNSDGSAFSASFFKYRINGRMMYISDHPFVDNWMIMEQSKNKFVLQAYRPDLEQVVFTYKY